MPGYTPYEFDDQCPDNAEMEDIVNQYANYNPTCGGCGNYEEVTLSSGTGICDAIRDAVQTELNILPTLVIVRMDQNASRCDMFEPTDEFERSMADQDAYESDKDKYNGVSSGVDFPATL